MSVQFYGKCDRNKYGKIASVKPAWTMDTHIEELRERIDSKKRALERGEIPPDSIMQAKEEIAKEEGKLSSILESKPNFTGGDKDKIWKIYKDIGNDIRNAMFTRSDMKMGFASPHEEARRMKDNGLISVSREVADICQENNIKVRETKNGLAVSRDGATQLWKLSGYALGEPTNVEVLRRDKATARTGYRGSEEGEITVRRRGRRPKEE